MLQAVNGKSERARRWARIEPLAVGLLAWSATSTELRERLEANIAAARTALDVALADPWVPGSTGQPKPHPGFAVARDCDQTALALYRELTHGLDDAVAGLGRELAELERSR